MAVAANMLVLPQREVVQGSKPVLQIRHAEGAIPIGDLCKDLPLLRKPLLDEICVPLGQHWIQSQLGQQLLLLAANWHRAALRSRLLRRTSAFLD